MNEGLMSDLDRFYINRQEPVQSCLLALRDIILGCDKNITPEWKYRLPFFYYKKKMLCYFWFNNKTGEPYIGFVDGKFMNHPLLEQGDRLRMKILRINPLQYLPLEVIQEIVAEAITLKESKVKLWKKS